jgi:hypothetical protein
MTEIENKIKEKLLNEEAAWVNVDSGALWSGIQGDLAAPRRKKGFWIAGALGILIASVAVWYALNQPAQGDAYATKQYNTDTSLKVVETSSSTQLVVAAVNATSEEPVVDPQANQLAANKMNSTVRTDQVAQIMAAQSEPASQVQPEEQLADPQGFAEVEDDEPTNETEIANDQAEIDSQESVQTMPLDINDQAMAEVASDVEPVNEADQNTAPTPISGSNTENSTVEVVEEDPSSTEDVLESTLSENSTELEELVSNEVEIASPDTSIVMTIGDPNIREGEEIPVVEGVAPLAYSPLKGLEFGVYGGFNRTGIAYTNDADPNVAQFKNQSERGEWGSTFGLSARKQIKNGWFAELGVEKSTSWTKFEYDAEYTVDAFFENELIEIVIDGSTGDTTDLVYGTAEGTIFHDRYVKDYTKVSMTSIPLMVGKTFDLNTIHVGISAGPVLNLVQSQEGLVFNLDSEIVRFDSAGENAPLDEVDLGARISGFVNYKLNQTWSIQLNSSASQVRKKDDDDLTTRFRWWTAAIGLNYNFR